MAITGSYTTKDGVTHSACYANIKRADMINYDTKRGSFYLNLYDSKELKNAGKKTTDQRIFNVSGDDFSAIFTTKDWRDGAYVYVKSQEEFSNWQDI